MLSACTPKEPDWLCFIPEKINQESETVAEAQLLYHLHPEKTVGSPGNWYCVLALELGCSERGHQQHPRWCFKLHSEVSKNLSFIYLNLNYSETLKGRQVALISHCYKHVGVHIL